MAGPETVASGPRVNGGTPPLRLLFAVLLLVPLGLVACSDAPVPDPTPPPEVPDGHGFSVVHDVGLEAPQAVLYDVASDRSLVSTIAEDEASGAATGFISRLKPNGEVDALRWIDGAAADVPLRGPGGMAIRGDTLMVADMDCLHLFDRRAGDLIDSICLHGPGRLNDVAVDLRGKVYATSEGAPGGGEEGRWPAVYSVESGSGLQLLFEGEELGRPRGIASGPRGVFFCGSNSGEVFQVRPEGPRLVFRGKDWHLTGIVFTPDGSFALSNPKDSSVIIVLAREGGAKGDVFTLARNVPTPGDLGYDLRRERVLIPRTGSNSLLFVDLWPK